MLTHRTLKAGRAWGAQLAHPLGQLHASPECLGWSPKPALNSSSPARHSRLLKHPSPFLCVWKPQMKFQAPGSGSIHSWQVGASGKIALRHTLSAPKIHF